MEKETGAICGDGMCPYIPCKDYPNCKHIKVEASASKPCCKNTKEKNMKIKDFQSFNKLNVLKIIDNYEKDLLKCVEMFSDPLQQLHCQNLVFIGHYKEKGLKSKIKGMK